MRSRIFLFACALGGLLACGVGSGSLEEGNLGQGSLGSAAVSLPPSPAQACASFSVANLGMGIYSGTTRGAGNHHSSGCGGQDGEEAVLGFIAPVTGQYTFSTVNSALDTVLYLLPSDCRNAVLACNDNASPTTTHSEVTMTLQRGQSINVVIDSKTDVGNVFNLSIVLKGTTQEVAFFDCVDNDNDSMMDCADPDYHDPFGGVCPPEHNCGPIALEARNGSPQLSGREVAFDVRQLQNGQPDPDFAESFAYLWDFGDGNFGTGIRASHAYAAPGRYTARVTAVSANQTVSAQTEVVVDDTLKTTFLPSVASTYQDWYNSDDITWATNLRIQNTDMLPADVIIYYYAGANLDTTWWSGGDFMGYSKHTLPANSAQTISVNQALGLPNDRGGMGSAIVLSNRKLVASVVVYAYSTYASYDQYFGPAAMSTYNGFTAGQTSVTIPDVIRRGDKATNSELDIMNVSRSSATVTVQFLPNAGGTPPPSQQLTIGPGLSYLMPTTYMDLGAFDGSARITSSQPVAVVHHRVRSLMEEIPNSSRWKIETDICSTEGKAPSSLLYLPIVRANLVQSTLTLNNPLGTGRRAMLNFGPNRLGLATPTARPVWIGPNSSIQISFTPAYLNGPYEGPVTIDADGPLLGTLEQVLVDYPQRRSSYEALNRTDASNALVIPLVQRFRQDPRATDGARLTSQITCQNIGLQSTQIEVMFSKNTAPTTYQPANQTAYLAPRASKTFDLKTLFGTTELDVYDGTARVVSSFETPIVCVVEQTGSGQRDKYMASAAVPISVPGPNACTNKICL